MRATRATVGVLPLPPTQRLPTLTTGRASRRLRLGLAPYQRRLQTAAAPYSLLAAVRITMFGLDDTLGCTAEKGIRRCAGSMYQTERPHDSAAGRRQELRDHSQRLV